MYTYSMQPQTLSILLVDGTPLGVRIAEVGNTIAQAIAIPRKLWNEMKGRNELTELQNAGAYFLLSNPSDDGRYDLYVGQSSNVRSRIDQHMVDNSKDFWNTVVCFVARGGGMNSAHAAYLEQRAFGIASAVGRSVLQNRVQPLRDTLSNSDRVKAERFFEDMRLLLSTLGYPVLEERTRENKLYYCKNKFAAGKGYYTNEGFMVLKGSQARKDVARHLKNNPFRQHLLDEKVLKASGDHYIFARDYLFTAPSAAADAILGVSANGWDAWKDKDGHTLDENVRQQK